jgi:hypothetical protein
MIGGKPLEKLTIKNRQADAGTDELYFYRGRIYNHCGPNDDRLQVRIMPHLAAVPDNEVENLPCYPSFFKGEVIQGLSEVENGKERADFVGVIATPDLQFGYVLGLMNDMQGVGKKERHINNYNLNGKGGLKDFLARRGLLPSSFEYKDIVMTRCVNEMDEDDQALGGQFELYNKKTGDYFIILSSGTMFTLQTGRACLRVGSPGQTASQKVPFSKILLEPGKLSFEAPTIEFNYKSLILGKHGKHPLSTLGSYSSIAWDGMDIGAIDNIVI